MTTQNPIAPFIDFITLKEEDMACPDFPQTAVFDEDGYGTRLNIRCKDRVFFLSANVGRFGRPDDVFGYRLPDIVEKTNRLLSERGLPVFTPDARVSRVDLAACLSFCSDLPLVSFFPGKWYRFVRNDCLIVDADGSPKSGSVGTWNFDDISLKVCAAHELVQSSLYAPQCANLIAWLKENGVLRFEVTLKSRYLSQTGFSHLGSLLKNSAWLDTVFAQVCRVWVSPEAAAAPAAAMPDFYSLPSIG